MKTHIVRVGNSRAVRLPKPLLEESGLAGEVEIRAEQGRIIIESARHPRAGWAEAARAMAEHGEDQLLDELMERVKEVIELCLEVEGDDGESLDFVGVQRITIAA